MADKVCTNCGSEVPAAAVFCTQCGSRDLTEAAAPPPPEQPPTAAITPDSPTVPVEDTYEPRSYAAQAGAPAAPVAPDVPAMADQTVVAEPTAVWTPPPAPAPAPAPPATAPPGPIVPPYGSPTPGPGGPDPVAARAAGGGKVGAVLVLLGGAAAIIGAFLEWMKITPEWADAVTLNGWTLSDDAKIAAAVGAVAVIAAIVVLGGSLRGTMRVLTAIAGIVLVALGAYDTYDILQRLPDELEAVNVSGVEIAAPGIGLILIIAGGAVVLLGALAMRGRKQDASTTPRAGSPAPGVHPGPPAASEPPVGGYAPPPSAPSPQYPAPGTATGGYGQPPGGYAPPQPGGYPPPAPPFR